MKNSDKRYFTPNNSKEAMRQIEKLFNQYKDAPLTNELLEYHQSLIQRLNTDILAAAKQEGIAQRVTAIASMTSVMQMWTKLKLKGLAFNGQMKHFEFVKNNAQPKFKSHVHKIKGNQSHRSSRH